MRLRFPVAEHVNFPCCCRREFTPNRGKGQITGVLNSFLANARNCGSSKIEGAWHCGYG